MYLAAEVNSPPVTDRIVSLVNCVTLLAMYYLFHSSKMADHRL